jgi:hypothetical protein
MRPRARGGARGPGDAAGRPMTLGLSWLRSTLPHRLEAYLARWPLLPPPFWRQPTLWVGWGLLVWVAETVTPAPVHTVPLSLVAVLLAAWAGNFAWSLGLAGLLPWGSLVSWWWCGEPWPWWMELLNSVGEMVEMGIAAVLMTAVQRHAVRLALERDPRLARRQRQRRPAG